MTNGELGYLTDGSPCFFFVLLELKQTHQTTTTMKTTTTPTIQEAVALLEQCTACYAYKYRGTKNLGSVDRRDLVSVYFEQPGDAMCSIRATMPRTEWEKALEIFEAKQSK